MWSVQAVKARLFEVVSARLFQAGRRKKHLGRWLVESAPRGAPIELPPRGSDRGDPFAAS